MNTPLLNYITFVSKLCTTLTKEQLDSLPKDSNGFTDFSSLYDNYRQFKVGTFEELFLD